jgi:UDP-N-acetylglucosamine diphosphorylase/glucosamine-1-phosphate N-acetyltransferase
MKEFVLNDKEIKADLFPFASIRNVADIRIGILTIREKWETLSGRTASFITEILVPSTKGLIIPANIVPTKKTVAALLATGDAGSISRDATHKIIQYPWHIFQLNDWALREDYELVTSGRVSARIPDGVQAIAPENIFIEENAVLSACVLNASHGPIYIGKHAEVMEGAVIRGPFALCEGAVVKMGSRIYGATTVGPYSIAGGEIKNTVIFGYSNKGHDGYLGDAVIGEWCNLGAGTSNSNLKNNAGEVKVWNPFSQQWRNAGIKCGLLMGDYSRSAINTSFNTGTVVGICSNVFGEGLTPAFLPNFSWGFSPIERYEFEKAIRDISNWKKLKNKAVTHEEHNQLKNIFNQS